MVVVPKATPLTTPVEEPIVAIAIFAEVQTPPLAISLKIVVAPGQTVVIPVIEPALGNGLTVINFDAIIVPHELVTVYLIVLAPAVTPVTTPEPETVALVLLLLHTPPAAPSDRLMDKPTHTLDGPVIVPASGNGFIVIIFVAVAVPHELVTIYLIVCVPAEAPVTTPDPETVAVALLLLHTPPVTASDKLMEKPAHTLEGPVIVPAPDAGFTVIIFVAVAVQLTLVTVYIIVSVPDVAPVTTPNPETVALLLLLLHVPPAAPSDNEIDEPTHTLDAPVIVPAFGVALTVTVFVVIAAPHPILTV